MSTVLKIPKGLKDLECKKGQLSSWSPILYVPLMDLVTTKEVPERLKIKLLDRTIFNTSIFFQRNTKEYLVHVIVVLHLSNQKRLNMHCRKLAKAVDKLARKLENFQKAVGTKGLVPKDEMESCKLELGQTQEMLQEAQKAHNKAIAKMYKLLRNILSGGAKSQLD
jgi:hypothetical protein